MPTKPKKLADPDALVCPEWLPEPAKSVWSEVYPRVADVCKARDTDQLAHLCLAISQVREAAQHIAAEGMIVTTLNRNGGQYAQVNPWVTIQNKALELIIKIGSRFGLTPADRMGLAQPPPKDDQFEKFLSGK